ncbi:hypothetical protein HMPREF1051_1122 [Neisseria sicca VK64]|uniref:Uncharacterized protein n=1 Tax=Neisseria sicca VK64 TaxID=1095748 RepID=I2NXE1_NEISI|nr:hypothetical protein HMPREF1051_1122 [Neisseria sicca VK64]
MGKYLNAIRRACFQTTSDIETVAYGFKPALPHLERRFIVDYSGLK